MRDFPHASGFARPLAGLDTDGVSYLSTALPFVSADYASGEVVLNQTLAEAFGWSFSYAGSGYSRALVARPS